MRRKDREVTDQKELAKILDSCKTCYLAMVDEGKPYLVPLSYGYEFIGDNLILYFHCAKEGRKLDILRTNPQICFEISMEGEPVHANTPCNAGYYYSSIIGDGNIIFLTMSARNLMLCQKCFCSKQVRM